jgi:hypothetical protein
LRTPLADEGLHPLRQDILFGPGRFEAGDARFWRRTVVAWLWWLAAFAVLGLTSG